MLAAAGTDMRQNHKLGGGSHIALLHMGQLDGENGGLRSRKKEVKMLVGEQILELRLMHGGKYRGPPGDFGQ